MKKIFTFLFLGAAVVCNTQAQKILANWDGKNPVSVLANAGTVTQDVANPAPGGINTSAKVLQYDRSADINSSFKLTFDSTRLLKYPKLLVSVYAPTTGTIKASIVDSYGDTISLTKDITAATAWIEDTFNFSLAAGIRPYKSVILYPDPSATTAATYYFDDFKLIGLNAGADSSVIARETFGNADFRQRGAGGLTPPFNYPDPNWTAAVASVHGPGLATVYGNDTWYPYTMKQNVPAGQKGLTIKNGNWNTTYGMWVSGRNYLSATGTYTNSTGEGCTLFAPTGRYNFGWDSIQIDNIDISGFNNLGIGFGMAFRDAISQNVFIYYKIDGDLTWTQFCDINAFINPPTTQNVFTYVTTPKLASSVRGNKMSILFRGFETNNTNRYVLDDITLTGSPIAVVDIDVSATSGNMQVGEDLQIQSVASPSYAYDPTVIWSVTNGNATISATGLLHAVSVGTVYAKAVSADNPAIKDSILITISPATNVKNLELANVNIFPNPVDKMITISGNLVGIRNVEILNVQGKLVGRIQKMQRGNFINVSNLPSGVYILRITNSSNEIVTKRFIKK
jgi:hypothetical protein